MMSDINDNPFIDITANKHGGNKQSQAANVQIAPFKLTWKERILGYMSERDAQGLGTSRRHACDHFGKELGQIGGRFTELKAEELIEDTNFLDRGCMIYRLTGSTKVPVKEPNKRALVIGPGLVGEIVLEKGTAGWQIATITPNLKSIVGDTPVSEIGTVLAKAGLTYNWIGS